MGWDRRYVMASPWSNLGPQACTRSGAAQMLGEENLPEYPEHSRENSQTITEKIELAMFEAVGISFLIDELANSMNRKIQW